MTRFTDHTRRRPRRTGATAPVLAVLAVFALVLSPAAARPPGTPGAPAPIGDRSTVLRSAGALATVTGVRTSRVLGYTRQHRPIVAYEMGNPAAPFRTLVLGSMHGYYERAGEQVVAAILRQPVSMSIDLWVIPTINPDGDAMHRRGNANGVDLNRNWPNAWTFILPGPDNFDSHYSGPFALSEPETQAMYNFLTVLRPNRMVSMHQPLDAVDSTDGGPRDISFRNALANNLQLPISALNCWSTCHGSMTGWLTATQPGAAITVEFPQNVSPAYLSGQAASGVLAALIVGVRPPPPPLVDGHLDTIRASPGTVSMVGWVLDHQRPASAGAASVSIDGRTVRTVSSNVARPDVDRVMHVTGPHGFSFSVVTAPGVRRVCVTARPVAGTTTVARQLGACSVVTVPPYIFQGHLDSVTPRAHAVRSVGWALDPLYPTARTWVRIWIDGHPVKDVRTSLSRADVNRVMHVAGLHGFDVTFDVSPGRHTLDVTPLPVGTSSLSQVLPPVHARFTVPAK